MKTLDWHDINQMPKGLSVDVLYINETFNPASCGILYEAKTYPGHEFFVTDDGAMVPAIYCVGWRRAQAGKAKIGIGP